MSFDKSKQSRGEQARAKIRAAQQFTPAKFIQFELDADQKRQCKAWLPDITLIDDGMLKACESGYKFSVKYDDYSSAYACWMQPTSADSPNAGYILSGRGSTPLKAIKQCLYKHHMVFEGTWDTSWSKGDNDIDD